jgi:hypothetical protein
MKDVREALGAASAFQKDLVAILLPATFVDLLVFLLAGIARTGLRLDIVPPHVFGALAVGPNVLASDGARVTTNALVEVEHHRNL